MLQVIGFKVTGCTEIENTLAPADFLPGSEKKYESQAKPGYIIKVFS
jgi:hypothetical protein